MKIPIESLEALKKFSKKKGWFDRKNFVYYGPGGYECLMFSHFCKISAVVCEDYGDDVRQGIENDWGIPVFSYEKNKRVRHNASSLFTDYFFKDHGKEIVAKLKKLKGDLCFLPFASTVGLQEFLFHQGRHYRLFQNPVIVQNYFDYKARLAWRAAELGVPIPPESSLALFGSLAYQELAARYTNGFVVQTPLAIAGAGTDIVQTKDDFDRMIEQKKKALGDSFMRTQVKITPFLSGPSFNCTGAIINGAVALSQPCVQIVGDPSLSPLKTQYSGSDFSLKLPEDLYRKILAITERIGQWMGQNNYKGNFGVDFLSKTSSDGEVTELYVSEINARLVGESEYMADFEAMKDVVPLTFFHLAEFLGLDIEPSDVHRYNRIFLDGYRNSPTATEGSAMHLYSLEKGIFRVPGKLLSGTYRYENGRLNRVSAAIRMCDSKHPQDFIIVNGVPWKELVIGHPRYGDSDVFLCTVRTRESVLEPNDWRILNRKWKEIIALVRKELALVPCAYRSIRE